MRAIISDVHGNAEAFEAVLADIDKRGITDIISLGDLIGYGPEPSKCIKLAANLEVHLLGNHEEAIAPYRRVLRIKPDDVPALVNLADVYMRRGDHEISYQLLSRAARLEPEYPNVIFGLGQYYEAIGEYTKAISQYDRIIDWPAARFRLLLVRLKQGDIEAAFALVERFESQSGISEETAGFRRLVQLYSSQDTTGRALVVRDTIPPGSGD